MSTTFLFKGTQMKHLHHDLTYDPTAALKSPYLQEVVQSGWSKSNDCRKCQPSARAALYSPASRSWSKVCLPWWPKVKAAVSLYRIEEHRHQRWHGTSQGSRPSSQEVNSGDVMAIQIACKQAASGVWCFSAVLLVRPFRQRK